MKFFKEGVNIQDLDMVVANTVVANIEQNSTFIDVRFYTTV